MTSSPTPRHPPLPFSPASERNQQPILDVLAPRLAAHARVLEIASGTGQHAAHFARHQPGWYWQPTDFDAAALPTIAARCAGLAQVQPPLQLDVQSATWPVAEQAWDALYCANMIHIAPWSCTPGLMAGAARSLQPGGALYLYGPFLVDGEPTAPGNIAFDADLQRRHPAWGLRTLAAVCREAEQVALHLEERIGMPANNEVWVFRRSAPSSR